MKLDFYSIYQRLPFALQFTWNPFLALDLTDDEDYPDHNKILPTLATGGIFVCALAGHPLGAVVSIAVLSASFGLSIFKQFLDSKQYSATSADEIKASISNLSTTTRTITEQLVSSVKHDPGA